MTDWAMKHRTEAKWLLRGGGRAWTPEEHNAAADEIERLRGVLQSAFEDMQSYDDVSAFMTLKHECAPLKMEPANELP